MTPTLFFHGTPATLLPGERLIPATTESGAYGRAEPVVYLTRTVTSARQWGKDACEMLGLDAVVHVYACAAPDAKPQPHADDPDQWVSSTAFVLREV